MLILLRLASIDITTPWNLHWWSVLPCLTISPPFLPCQRCWRFGHPAKHNCSTAHCPVCAKPGHDRSNCPAQLRMCANYGGSHNVLYRTCPAYKLGCEEAVLRFTLGLTLREDRRKAGWRVFLSLPIPKLPFPSSQDISESSPVRLGSLLLTREPLFLRPPHPTLLQKLLNTYKHDQRECSAPLSTLKSLSYYSFCI